MLSVSDILPPEHIFTGAEWRSKKRVFEQASIAFENAGGAARDKIFAALMQRERLGSTYIGNGGAIPHGRLEGAKSAMCALALLQQPIQYGIIGEGGGEVRALFFLIAPADADETHLRLLGRFSEMLSDASLMESLHGCADGAAAAALISRWESSRGAAD
ncbi:MAG: PTS sugar transporter subunit IIA [Gammaproteobacteria bacterium]